MQQKKSLASSYPSLAWQLLKPEEQQMLLAYLEKTKVTLPPTKLVARK